MINVEYLIISWSITSKSTKTIPYGFLCMWN